MAIVTGYGKLWPREIFDIFNGKTLIVRAFPDLQQTGVYILYRDDTPYYVGKATDSLYKRLHDHSNKTTDDYFNFWNYFSFFVVSDISSVGEVEGILVASMPTANRSVPTLPP